MKILWWYVVEWCDDGRAQCVRTHSAGYSVRACSCVRWLKSLLPWTKKNEGVCKCSRWQNYSVVVMLAALWTCYKCPAFALLRMLFSTSINSNKVTLMDAFSYVSICPHAMYILCTMYILCSVFTVYMGQDYCINCLVTLQRCAHAYYRITTISMFNRDQIADGPISARIVRFIEKSSRGKSNAKQLLLASG